MVELVVAMALGAIVTTLLFQVIAGQGRFVGLQSAREEVQQNTRAAIELIGSELRTLPAGDALVRADGDSLTLRSAVVWGVVCAVAAPSLDVLLPVLPGVTYATNRGTGVVVNVGTQAAPAWTEAVDVTGIGPAQSDCAGVAVPPGTERRSVTLASIPQTGGVTPTAGQTLYLYEQVTYRTGVSAGIPGRWIQRRVGDGGASSNQPMAGPVDDSAGLRFQYFDGPSTTALPTPLTDDVVRSSVTRVIVAVKSVGRGAFGDGLISKADTVVVTLRNRL